MGRIALLAVVATLASLGCDGLLPPTGCTLIGCTSTIDLALPVRFSSVYTVTVTSPTVSGSVECVPPDQADPNAVWSERAFGGDLREQGPAIATVVCGEDRLSLQFFEQDPAMPDELTVEIDGEHTLAQTFRDIPYSVSHPNGPDCPPTCNQVELTLDAP